jgi:hypothetical protein
MKPHHMLLIGGFAVLGLSQQALAQSERPSRTILVYVSPLQNEHFSLSPTEHVLMFKMPVQIPGVALPAGPYIFRQLTESVLQVLSADRSKIYATFMTIPASGIGDTTRERIKFELNPEDDLPRIAGWYLPGLTGHEFLYPKPKRVHPERPADR